MRRKDREITDIKKIEAIISGARYMHLGMFDGEVSLCCADALRIFNGKRTAHVLYALCKGRVQN